MKFLIAFVALVAVATARQPNSDLAQMEAIIAAIQSPSTDPATAALLEQQLFDIINANNPIAVGPIVIPEPEPISVGPEIIDIPVPLPTPIVPSPVVIGEIPAGESPLVQIIVNVNKASAAEVAPVKPVIVRPEPVPTLPVTPVKPIIVRPEPVPTLPIPVDPVDVVDAVPVPVEPVQIGVPVIPEPVVILPEELN